MTNGCFSKRRRDNKVIQLELRTDSRGPYAPYCRNEEHEGFIFNGEYRRCERKRCKHYIRFRPDSPLTDIS